MLTTEDHRLSQESRVDLVMEISEQEADETMRALAKVEGIFAGSLASSHLHFAIPGSLYELEQVQPQSEIIAPPMCFCPY